MRARCSRSAASRRSFDRAIASLTALRTVRLPGLDRLAPGRAPRGTRGRWGRTAAGTRRRGAGHEVVERRTVERELTERLRLAGERLAERHLVEERARRHDLRSRRAGRRTSPCASCSSYPDAGHREQQRAEQHVAGVGVAGVAARGGGCGRRRAGAAGATVAGRTPTPCAGPRRRRAMRRRRRRRGWRRLLDEGRDRPPVAAGDGLEEHELRQAALTALGGRQLRAVVRDDHHEQVRRFEDLVVHCVNARAHVRKSVAVGPGGPVRPGGACGAREYAAEVPRSPPDRGAAARGRSAPGRYAGGLMADTPGQRFFFLHIMKTGGALVPPARLRQLPAPARYIRTRSSIRTCTRRTTTSPTCSGFPPNGTRRSGPTPATSRSWSPSCSPYDTFTFTILREPVARTISYLKHCKRYHEQHREPEPRADLRRRVLLPVLHREPPDEDLRDDDRRSDAELHGPDGRRRPAAADREGEPGEGRPRRA